MADSALKLPLGPCLAQARERSTGGTGGVVVVGSFRVSRENEAEVASSALHGGQVANGGTRSQSLNSTVVTTEYTCNLVALRMLLRDKRVTYGQLATYWNRTWRGKEFRCSAQRARDLVLRDSGPGTERMAMLPEWIRGAMAERRAA